MEKGGKADVREVAKDDGNGGGNVMPQKWGLEHEEENARQHHKKSRGNVDRPLSGVLPSASKKEHGVALKVLVVAMPAPFLPHGGALRLGPDLGVDGVETWRRRRSGGELLDTGRVSILSTLGLISVTLAGEERRSKRLGRLEHGARKAPEIPQVAPSAQVEMRGGLVRARDLAQRSNALREAATGIVAGRARRRLRRLVKRVVLGEVGAARGQMPLVFAVHDVLELDRRSMVGHGRGCEVVDDAAVDVGCVVWKVAKLWLRRGGWLGCRKRTCRYGSLGLQLLRAHGVEKGVRRERRDVAARRDAGRRQTQGRAGRAGAAASLADAQALAGASPYLGRGPRLGRLGPDRRPGFPRAMRPGRRRRCVAVSLVLAGDVGHVGGDNAVRAPVVGSRGGCARRVGLVVAAGPRRNGRSGRIWARRRHRDGPVRASSATRPIT